jgi:hypothetical protein
MCLGSDTYPRDMIMNMRNASNLGKIMGHTYFAANSADVFRAATLPGFDATSWHGLFAPARTPRPVIDALAGEVKRIFETPQLGKTLLEIGAVPSPMTPEQFSQFVSSERRKWQEVVQAAGVEVQ